MEQPDDEDLTLRFSWPLEQPLASTQQSLQERPLGCNRLRLGSGGSFLVAVLKSQGSLSFFDLLLFAVPSLSDLFILYSHSCSWSKNICPVAKADLKGYHEAKGQESKAKLRAESLSRYSKLTVHFD